jgi:hypothetical protein
VASWGTARIQRTQRAEVVKPYFNHNQPSVADRSGRLYPGPSLRLTLSGWILFLIQKYFYQKPHMNSSRPNQKMMNEDPAGCHSKPLTLYSCLSLHDGLGFIRCSSSASRYELHFPIHLTNPLQIPQILHFFHRPQQLLSGSGNAYPARRLRSVS